MSITTKRPSFVVVVPSDWRHGQPVDGAKSVCSYMQLVRCGKFGRVLEGIVSPKVQKKGKSASEMSVCAGSL